MSKLDIVEAEIARRKKTTEGLILGEADLLATQEQFNKLDEMYRADEKTSRERLEAIYKENRHFSGKQPVVYSFALTEKYPFFGGQTDADCNPYFPITKVQNGTSDGLAPLFAAPTRTGAHQRDVTYSAIESATRTPALSALQAFPDISQEPLPVGWPGPQNSTPAYCSGATGSTQAICLSNGGTWVPSSPIPDPVWVGANTAPAKLRTALQAWKTDIQTIKADLFEDTSSVEQNYWQSIINNIDIVLAAVASNAVFVRATGNPNPAAWGQTQSFTPGSPPAIARSNLITAAQTNIPSHVSSRLSSLNSIASKEEQIFFEVIKLRMHQANGSFVKLKTIKYQLKTNKSIIDDNNAAISSLNILKVKNS